HHHLLIYPFQQIFIAAAIFQVATLDRGILKSMLSAAGGLIVVALIASNLIVVSQYHDLMAQSPGSKFFSTAFFGLTDVLLTDYLGRSAVIVDWYIANPLAILSEGQLDVIEAAPSYMDPTAGVDRARKSIEDPRSTFVVRSPGTESAKAAADAFWAAARSSGS